MGEDDFTAHLLVLEVVVEVDLVAGAEEDPLPHLTLAPPPTLLEETEPHFLTLSVGAAEPDVLNSIFPATFS